MTNTKTKKKPAPVTGPVLTVTMQESGYGTARPTLTATFAKNVSVRVMRATILQLAAQVELASTAPDCKWHVQVDSHVGWPYTGISLHLELQDADLPEAEAALFVLRTVAGGQ